MATGTYRIPKLAYEVAVALTNTTPVGAFRGAGRPEAAAFLERVMDVGAAELGIDPVELRRRNFLQPDEIRVLNLATMQTRPLVAGKTKTVVVGKRTPTVYFIKTDEHELCAADRETDVRYEGGQRSVRRFAPAETLPATAHVPPATLRRGRPLSPALPELVPAALQGVVQV